MPSAPLPPNEAERLAALHTYHVLDTAYEDAFDSIARLAAQLVGCPISTVSLVDAERQWFKSSVGWSVTQGPRTLAFCAHTILDGSRPLVVTDATKDARFSDNACVTGEPFIRSYLGVPLVNPEGHALGTLCVIDKVARDFNTADIEIMTTLAGTVMTTLELRRSIGRLRAKTLIADDRLADIVEASPTALALVRTDGRIKHINKHAEQMFGYGRGELIDQPIERLMPGRFHASHVGLRSEFMRTETYRRTTDRRDLVGLRKDGVEFPVEIGLNVGEIEGERFVLAGIIDITEQREIERERERRRQELTRSNADLEEFAYVVSHDLKAPLRGIAHLAEWITEDIGTSASADTLENLRLLDERVKRLQTLQDALLSYARVGRINSAIEDVDIADLVSDIATLLAPPTGFVVACETPTPVLRARRAPLRVVLENLIGNALKHHDRAEGRVVVSARERGEMMEFRVTDDGPGIPPQYHDRIFTIFQTLGNRGDAQAGGIGLAIVKRQVESHGGAVRVESAPPARGTTFVFTWKDTA